jgi:hypothetical protein
VTVEDDEGHPAEVYVTPLHEVEQEPRPLGVQLEPVVEQLTVGPPHVVVGVESIVQDPHPPGLHVFVVSKH